MTVTLPRLLLDAMARHGDRLALGRRTASEASPWSYRRLAAGVRDLALGLHGLGIRRGHRVALFSENRREWLLADLALASLGAVDVPRGADAPGDELAFILRHSGSRALLVETPDLLQKLRSKTDLSAIQPVILLTGRATGALAFHEILEQGAARANSRPGEFESLVATVDPQDLLTIVYTSGTTANPKGVCLTHANLTANLLQLHRHLPRHALSGRGLSPLPTWHMFERTIEYFVLWRGFEVWYSDVRRFRQDLRSIRPTVVLSVPRVWEAVHAAVVEKAARKGPAARALFGLGCRLGRRAVRWNERAGRSTKRSRSVARALRATVFKSLYEATGGALEVAVSGGGTLPLHVDEFFLGAGFHLLNGYGLTETAPILAARHPDANVPGTIGTLMPDTRMRIVDEAGEEVPDGVTGRLLVRGPQVMLGYHDNPAATREVLGADGWFDTGDLVTRRADGLLVHSGRAKETIVLRGGENVDPQSVEVRLTQSPLIDQAMVLGQDAKTLAALLVPHRKACAAILGRELEAEREGELQDEGLRRLLQDEIQRTVGARSGLPPAMRVGPFAAVADPFTPENGLLTQTLKMRRAMIRERHGRLAAALLQQAGVIG